MTYSVPGTCHSSAASTTPTMLRSKDLCGLWQPPSRNSDPGLLPWAVCWYPTQPRFLSTLRGKELASSSPPLAPAFWEETDNACVL